MESRVYMDTDSLDLINFSLEEKTKQLDNLYKELNREIEELNGSSQTWKGKAQEVFYNHYTSVSAHFPDVIDQLNSYTLFLAETIENYNRRNDDISKDIDKNENNLNVN